MAKPVAKYAIVSTGSFGDIMNTTPIAAQLCKLGHEIHWYVASFYQSALAGNTDIDKVITIPTTNKSQSTLAATHRAIKLARSKNIYQKVIAPAPYLRKYWPTQKYFISDAIRLAAEEDLGMMKEDWLIPWRPILKLSEKEQANCKAFFSKLPDRRPVALFEWQAESGQSHLNSGWIEPICAEFKDWIVILSGSRSPLKKLPSNAVNGQSLSIRENAEAFNRSSFMIGVSSGISAVCHSTWTGSHIIPWVESCNSTLWSGAKYPAKKVNVVLAGNLESFIAEIRKMKNETS